MKPGKSAASTGVFPSRRHRSPTGPHRLVGRRLAADHLDERHQRHRIHEVHAEDAVRPLRRGADQRDRNRRRIRGEDDFGFGDRIETREQSALGVDVLDDRFDDVVGFDEAIERRRRRQPRRARRRGPRRTALPLLDEHVEAFSTPRRARSSSGSATSMRRTRESGLREGLRDAAAHRAGADDTDCWMSSCILPGAQRATKEHEKEGRYRIFFVRSSLVFVSSCLRGRNGPTATERRRW